MRGTVFQGTAFLGTIVAGEVSALAININGTNTIGGVVVVVGVAVVAIVVRGKLGPAVLESRALPRDLVVPGFGETLGNGNERCKKKESRKDLTKSPAVILFDVRGVLDVEEFDGSQDC